jgi:hypothetical protein
VEARGGAGGGSGAPIELRFWGLGWRRRGNSGELLRGIEVVGGGGDGTAGRRVCRHDSGWRAGGGWGGTRRS